VYARALGDLNHMDELERPHRQALQWQLEFPLLREDLRLNPPLTVTLTRHMYFTPKNTNEGDVTRFNYIYAWGTF
jgi:hypothetical protein